MSLRRCFAAPRSVRSNQAEPLMSEYRPVHFHHPLAIQQNQRILITGNAAPAYRSVGPGLPSTLRAWMAASCCSNSGRVMELFMPVCGDNDYPHNGSLSTGWRNAPHHYFLQRFTCHTGSFHHEDEERRKTGENQFAQQGHSICLCCVPHPPCY